MDTLRKEYAVQRKEYDLVLKQSLRETNEERMKVHVKKLLDLNSAMSKIVSSMMSLVAQTESKVDLTKLRNHLSEELLSIQRDAKKIHTSAGERRVLQSMYEQNSAVEKRENFTVVLYLFALGIGLLLVVMAILNATILAPAMPPISTPALSLPEVPLPGGIGLQ